MLAINHPAPDFSLMATNSKYVSLSDLIGKNVILYFYPKDCTSGCTQEGRDFSEHYKKFSSLNTVIFGISRDSIKLHIKFKFEQQFPFELLSDVEEKVCSLYNVVNEKKIYGKKVFSLVRSTFLIDKRGLLRREWRNVKVAGHVQEVLRAVGEL